MRFQYLFSILAVARTVSANDDATTAAPAPAAHEDRAAIEQMFSANPDDARLSIALRNYFEDLAAGVQTVSGLEPFYDAVTAIAAEITDNQAARNILTSKIGHHTAPS